METAKESVRTLFCLGSSMSPFLLPLDEMELVSYNGRKVKCGDVVVFTSPTTHQNVVHRVASVNFTKLITKGDNNSRVDTSVIAVDDIIGQVVYLRRGDKYIRIYGGLVGQLYAILIKSRRVFDKGVSFFIGRFYRWVARTGVFNWPVFNLLDFKIYHFYRKGKEEFQLFLGSSLIGRRLPKDNEWRIKRPFRIFVDGKIDKI